jgi:hypothetical protein
MSVATGTRHVKVPNVSIANDKKFTVGTTSMTIAEVETDGEDLKFTVKLPRQTMVGIKGVTFADAKGEALDGHRTSSGYMNDAAEMGFSVKTSNKTADARLRDVAGTADDQRRRSKCARDWDWAGESSASVRDQVRGQRSKVTGTEPDSRHLFFNDKDQVHQARGNAVS